MVERTRLMHDYLFGRHGKRFLIQIQIPITTFHHEFTVFKVTSFPISVTGRTSHSRPTSLFNLPRYFVASQ